MGLFGNPCRLFGAFYALLAGCVAQVGSGEGPSESTDKGGGLEPLTYRVSQPPEVCASSKPGQFELCPYVVDGQCERLARIQNWLFSSNNQLPDPGICLGHYQRFERAAEEFRRAGKCDAPTEVEAFVATTFAATLVAFNTCAISTGEAQCARNEDCAPFKDLDYSCVGGVCTKRKMGGRCDDGWFWYNDHRDCTGGQACADDPNTFGSGIGVCVDVHDPLYPETPER